MKESAFSGRQSVDQLTDNVDLSVRAIRLLLDAARVVAGVFKLTILDCQLADSGQLLRNGVDVAVLQLLVALIPPNLGHIRADGALQRGVVVGEAFVLLLKRLHKCIGWIGLINVQEGR